MIQVPRYIISLVALGLIISIQFFFPAYYFKILSSLIWFSNLVLMINLLVWVILYFSEESEDKIDEPGFSWNRVLLYSKLTVGLSLTLTALLFCLNYLLDKFSDYQYLTFKMFVPFALLFVIGRFILREPVVKELTDKIITKSTPFVQKWLTIADAKFKIFWKWALGKKWLIGGGAIALVLLFTLPSLLRPKPPEPQKIVLNFPNNDSILKQRNYDQRIPIYIKSIDSLNREVYLNVVQESGDSLMLGFVGSGSHYEDTIDSKRIIKGDNKVELLVHAAQCLDSIYDLKIQLFDADTLASNKNRLLDEKNIKLHINHGEPMVEFQLDQVEEFSLARYYTLMNKGSVISDFSLELDPELADKVMITPRFKNYKLEENDHIQFTLQPRLHVGFDSIEGTLYARSGSSPKLKSLDLKFKAPEGKTLFLAVSDCGSNSTTRVCECTNQGRTRVGVATPPENDGPYIPPDRGEGGRPGTVHPPITWPPPPDNDSQPPDEDPDEPEEPEILPPVDIFTPYDPEYVDKEQILSDLNALKVNLEAARDEFDDEGIRSRIDEGLDRIEMIEEYVNEVEGKYPPKEVVDKVNEDKPKVHDIFEEVVGHQSNNRARGNHNAGRPNPVVNESINMRFNNEVGSINNAGAPTIFNTPEHSHFAWHEPPRYENAKQRVYYSRHNSKGPVEIRQIEMNKPEEAGRWPFVIQGQKDNIFYVWQGGTDVKNSDVLFKRSTDNGKTWSDTKNLTNHGEGVFAPRLAYENGNLYAYWIDKKDSTNVHVSLSKNNGETFGRPVHISRIYKPDGVLKMVTSNDQAYFLYEDKYTDQKIYVVCHKVALSAIETGRILDVGSNKRRISEGSQPAGMIDKNNKMHIAYVIQNDLGKYVVRHNSFDVLRLMTITSNEVSSHTINGDQDYYLSPSLVADDNDLTVFYHVGERHHREYIDHLQTKKLNLNTLQWAKNVHRLPSFSTNSEKLYLSVQFDLPWSRSVYDEHDVKILLNGWKVAHLENTIPEGKMLFPVPSYILNYDGDRMNEVTLETQHFNPAAYLAASEIKLISDLSFVEQLVYATSQKEADDLLYSRKEFNHVQPDLGFYSTAKTESVEGLKDGDTLYLNLDLWNLGQGKSTESRIDIYGVGFKVKPDQVTDGNLYKQIKIGTIKPFQKLTKRIPVTYWSGMEKVIVKVTSKEKDFDTSNNYFTAALVNPDDKLYVPPTSSSLLRVAVFDAPGILAENMSFELVDTNYPYTVYQSQSNPSFWREAPSTYNLFIKSTDNSNIEQTISGIPITANFDIYDNPIQSTNVSLDIQLKNQDRLVDELEGTNTGSVITFDLDGELLFALNESDINEFAEDKLRKVIYLMSSYPNSTLLVEGHTDTQGNFQDNMTLSRRRAETVARWLITNGGFVSTRITIRGLGSTVPVDPSNTQEAHAKNRRVSFV